MNQQVTDYINNAPDEHRKIMEIIRTIARENIEGLREEFKWSRPVFGLEKDFAYLLSTKKGVNLGFYNFEQLDDPSGLLEGTGKTMRHIKIKSASDMDEKLIRDWFLSSSKR